MYRTSTTEKIYTLIRWVKEGKLLIDESFWDDSLGVDTEAFIRNYPVSPVIITKMKPSSFRGKEEPEGQHYYLLGGFSTIYEVLTLFDARINEFMIDTRSKEILSLDESLINPGECIELGKVYDTFRLVRHLDSIDKEKYSDYVNTLKRMNSILQNYTVEVIEMYPQDIRELGDYIIYLG